MGGAPSDLPPGVPQENQQWVAMSLLTEATQVPEGGVSLLVVPWLSLDRRKSLWPHARVKGRASNGQLLFESG